MLMIENILSIKVNCICAVNIGRSKNKHLGTMVKQYILHLTWLLCG
jgi:hypothetical protein